MKKWFLVGLCIFFSISKTFATDIEYPSWVEFERLQYIVDNYFVVQDLWHRSIISQNINYNEIIATELKLILSKTFEGNEDFYQDMFKTLIRSPQDILNMFRTYQNPYIVFHDNLLMDSLMDASFNVSYQSFHQDAFLNSVSRVIEQYKRRQWVYPSSLEYIWEQEIFVTIWGVQQSRKIHEFIDDLSYFIDGESFVLDYRVHDFSIDEALRQNREIHDINLDDLQKDYAALIWDHIVSDIPEIYKNIPNDAIFLHIQNPEFIFELMQSDKIWNIFSWNRVLKDLQTMIIDWLDVSDFDEITQNIENEVIIVFLDYDIISPQIVVILDEQDARFLHISQISKNMISKDGKTYIWDAQSIAQMLDSDLKSSIYGSDDFRYVWLKKWHNFQDFFFFAWDHFFNNILRFENYIQMYRKMQDFSNLYYIQHYVWAYRNIYNTNLQNLDDIFIDTDDINIDDFILHDDNIVEHRHIGTLDDVKNISQINYDISHVSRKELQSYQRNILNYVERWHDNLDPIGLIVNQTKNWIDIDFFMTPIPDIWGMIDFFRMFENLWKEEFNFIQDSKLRIWNVWIALWLNLHEFRDNIQYDSEIMYMISEVEQYILDGNSFFDYFWGEFMIWIWDIESSFFSGWNTELLDVFIWIEFQSNIRAREFINLIRRNIAREFSYGSIWEYILRPLQEEYKSQEIYTIPLDSFFFPVNLSYAILDNILYISLSKESIKKNIDVFLWQYDNSTQKFSWDNYISWEHIFYWWLNSPWIHETFYSLLDNEDLYISFKQGNIFIIPLVADMQNYYSRVAYARVKGEDIPSYNDNIWFLSFNSIDGEIYVFIDREKIDIENQAILEDINAFLDTLDSRYFEDMWFKIHKLWNNNQLRQLISIASYAAFIHDGDIKKYFNDIAIAFNIWDDEINMYTKIFDDDEYKQDREDDKNYSIQSIIQSVNNRIDIFKIIVILLGLVAFTYFIYEKKKKRV